MNSQKNSIFNRDYFYYYNYLHESRYRDKFDETNFNNNIFDKQI